MARSNQDEQQLYDVSWPERIIGSHEARNLPGENMVQNVEALEHMNPALGRSILEGGFGGASITSTLNYREWVLHSLSVLTAMGDCSEQLDVYLDAAFKHGPTKQEIRSIFNHAASSTTWRMVRVDHETLVRDSGGPGVPIVLNHALSMDGRMFQQLLPRLIDSGYRVLAYDLRGHGSARGAPVTVSLE
ncbi:hypothetical protein LTR17_027273 [Elasticomyces elasticus]|nr:hypothetical protein LTR17_027273 [Elasticomyces elasticus]